MIIFPVLFLDRRRFFAYNRDSEVGKQDSMCCVESNHTRMAKLGVMASPSSTPNTTQDERWHSEGEDSSRAFSRDSQSG